MLKLRHIFSVLLLIILFFLPDFLVTLCFDISYFSSHRLICNILIWSLISAFIYLVWPSIYGYKEKVYDHITRYSWSIRENYGMPYAILLIVSALFLFLNLCSFSGFSFYADRCGIVFPAILAFLSWRCCSKYDALKKTSSNDSDI